MDEARARELLAAERERVDAALADLGRAREEDREALQGVGDMADPAQPMTAEEADDAVASGLRARLGAIDRAEARLDEGTYGRSVRSGAPIPDERLEADPAAELTAPEAAER